MGGTFNVGQVVSRILFSDTKSEDNHLSGPAITDKLMRATMWIFALAPT